MSSSVIRVALVQLYSEPLSVASNFTKAESFIRDAASQGAHIAVLPEYHLTSWAPQDPRFLACCEQSPLYLERYQALAKELAIAIVPGTLVEHRAETSDLVNIAYFISDGGEVLSRYQKKNLWHNERPHLVADPSEHKAFDTALGGGCRVGMLVCWDLAFPEAMRELVRDGARVVIIPAFWLMDQYRDRTGSVINLESERVFLDSVVVARACESSAAVVFVNAGGPKPSAKGEDQSMSFCGASQVGMPLLGSQGRLGAEEGMSVVDVDLDTLDAAEGGYKVRADLGREGWHYGYSLVKEGEIG
ncbi:hypothetical protein VD0004_g8599 [Verticillium dahliae]|uniref:CN hydrolase domain-containing protein n=1 Tax=Verticillium dahliae TaxID=27337 RepID=A0A444RLT4_VERDA|nr:hypothetical protein VD0004_g8599 [Verticillium dahliae]PNH65182.1 hypothetical protein VD0001_g8579 [Verticillium dahliae]RXG42099.1 hypothetical protein VDGE_10064 [Verticillium dahliae]